MYRYDRFGPRHIGPYKVGARMGRGAQGKVFSAKRASDGALAALRVYYRCREPVPPVPVPVPVPESVLAPPMDSRYRYRYRYSTERDAVRHVECDRVGCMGCNAVTRTERGRKEFIDAAIEARVEREVAALRRLSAVPVPGVVKLLDYMPHATLTCKRAAGVSGATHPVCALALESTLTDLPPFVSLARRWPEAVIRRYAHDLLSTLYAVHSAGVVHLDIKPAALALDVNYGLKVTGFGASCFPPSVHAANLTSLVCTQRGGSTPYEMTTTRPGTGEYAGERVDVWAAGVCIFVLAAGFSPMDYAKPGDWWWDRLAAGETARFWAMHLLPCDDRLPENQPRFSPDLRELLNAMLRVDPATRATVAEAQAHRWFTAGPLATDAEVAAWMHLLHCTIASSAGHWPPRLPPILADLRPVEAALLAGKMSRAAKLASEWYDDDDITGAGSEGGGGGGGASGGGASGGGGGASGGGGSGGGGGGGGGGSGDDRDPFGDGGIMRSVHTTDGSVPSHHPRTLQPEMPMLVDATAATCASAIAALPRDWAPPPLPAGGVPCTADHVAALACTDAGAGLTALAAGFAAAGALTEFKVADDGAALLTASFPTDGFTMHVHPFTPATPATLLAHFTLAPDMPDDAATAAAALRARMLSHAAVVPMTAAAAAAAAAAAVDHGDGTAAAAAASAASEALLP